MGTLLLKQTRETKHVILISHIYECFFFEFLERDIIPGSENDFDSAQNDGESKQVSVYDIL